MWPTQYLKACNEIFLTGTALSGGKLFWWLSVIGDDFIAEKYIAKISLTVKSKLYEQSFTGPVHSFRASPETILSNGMCLCLTKETLYPFIFLKDEIKPISSEDGDDKEKGVKSNVGWNVTFSMMRVSYN